MYVTGRWAHFDREVPGHIYLSHVKTDGPLRKMGHKEGGKEGIIS
jgi:hypothetical protein